MEPHRTGRNEPQTPILEPGRTLGPYLVLSTLSASKRTTVYMAQDLSLDRPVALKAAPRGAVSVIAEGRTLARLNHPHIVTLYGLWPQPPTLILEYLVGETLKVRHERLDGVPETHIQNWMIALLGALESIHGQGIAHGAVRTDNVLLTTDQRIKLLDFRQTNLGETPPAPADDIRASGRLMQELLDSETSALADIARGALLGRYATARALRLAIASAHPEGGAIIATSEAEDRALAQASLAPALAETMAREIEHATETPANDAFAPAAITFPGPFDEPTHPLLSEFQERPGWGRQARGSKRLGLLMILLIAVVLFVARIGWPHREVALRPVAHIAHTVAQLAQGVLPQGPGTPPESPSSPAQGKAPAPAAQKASQVSTSEGAYAALAHAWGG